MQNKYHKFNYLHLNKLVNITTSAIKHSIYGLNQIEYNISQTPIVSQIYYPIYRNH